MRVRLYDLIDRYVQEQIEATTRAGGHTPKLREAAQQLRLELDELEARTRPTVIMGDVREVRGLEARFVKCGRSWVRLDAVDEFRRSLSDVLIRVRGRDYTIVVDETEGAREVYAMLCREFGLPDDWGQP